MHAGWLADPSVLAAGTPGIAPGSPVGYHPDLALQGATPAYLLPLLTFDELMKAWRQGGAQGGMPRGTSGGGVEAGGAGSAGGGAKEGAITVEDVHAHVIGLQHRFMEGLKNTGPAQGLLCGCELVNGATAPGVRSHTLVFRCGDMQQAAKVVAAAAGRGIAIDTRKQFVRLGFGFNHSHQDVAALLAALAV